MTNVCKKKKVEQVSFVFFQGKNPRPPPPTPPPKKERKKERTRAPFPSSEKGTSGIRHTSTTPDDSDACVAMNPDCLPMSLTMASPRYALEASTFAASSARCASSTAVSKPKQRSISRMSLSMDLGTPMTAQVTLFLTHSVCFVRDGWRGRDGERAERGRGESEFSPRTHETAATSTF